MCYRKVKKKHIETDKYIRLDLRINMKGLIIILFDSLI